jgi:hypothetical protein
VFRMVESVVIFLSIEILKIRGGKSEPKVDLIDMKAAC